MHPRHALQILLLAVSGLFVPALPAPAEARGRELTLANIRRDSPVLADLAANGTIRMTGAMYNLALVYESVDPRESIVQWERYIALASQLPSEKDWVDVARQHLRKLKGQVKD